MYGVNSTVVSAAATSTNREGVRIIITVTVSSNTGRIIGFLSLGKVVTVVLFLFGDGTILTTM